MTNIIVNEKNKDRISAYLVAANGRARTRTVDYDELIKVIKKLDGIYSMPTSIKNGLKISYVPSEKLPRAYKWTAQGTGVDLEFRCGAWHIVGAQRTPIYQSTGKCYLATLTESQKNYIISDYTCF